MKLATLKRLGLAAVAAAGLAAVTAAPANAYWRGHHHGWGGHGISFSFGTPGPYYYGGPYRSYAYGPDCFVRRVVRVNRFGQRVIVHRRVCY